MSVREVFEAISSNIESVSYEDGDLFITYKNHTTYVYQKVPREIFENLKKAESVGKFVNQYIKGKYLFEKC